MAAYYNENDPHAAQWLRNLIAANLIAPGDVDERSIEDVHPADLAGYVQCHFFAGIGIWGAALRRAGWPDSRPVWTGSCPCQPYSSAGKRAGVADERHLWPHWFHFLGIYRPGVVLGEQVASKDGRAWFDLVQTDLEGVGYAAGALDLCAAGFGAPHIRQRLYFAAHRVADSGSPGLPERVGHGRVQRKAMGPCEGEAAVGGSDAGRVADMHSDGRDQAGCGVAATGGDGVIRNGSVGRMADATSERPPSHEGPQRGVSEGTHEPGGYGGCAVRPGPTNGHWRAADWLLCRDGKWRPVEPQPQQMVDGSTEGVGLLCSEAISETEEKVNEWALRHSTDPGEALFNLWRVLSAEALDEWKAGGPWGLYEAPILLTFMRQLTLQGWRFKDTLACSRSTASQQILRSVRIDPESSDPLRELSQIMAHAAEKFWGKACRAYATKGFPLAKNAPARVGRLRAYGNGIVLAQATEFIVTLAETLHDFPESE